jgi:hypothetical protein
MQFATRANLRLRCIRNTSQEEICEATKKCAICGNPIANDLHLGYDGFYDTNITIALHVYFYLSWRIVFNKK